MRDDDAGKMRDRLVMPALVYWHLEQRNHVTEYERVQTVAYSAVISYLFLAWHGGVCGQGTGQVAGSIPGHRTSR